MSWLLVAGAAALGLGLLTVLVLLVPAARTPEQRVAAYAGAPAASPATDHAGAIDRATLAAGRVLHEHRGLEERIRLRLEGAGSRLAPAEWLLLHTGVLALCGLMGLLLGGVVLFVLFLLLGALGPWTYLGLRRSRRSRAFAAAVPDTLQLMAGSLSAGLSLAQAADAVTREGAEPVAGEFRRALVETRLGVPLEDALEGVAERFDSDDLRWAVMAIRIQREVGGNLAELLETVAATMREREYVRRQVATVSAEGRMSAWVLGSLPGLFLVYLLLFNRDYVLPLFTDPRGVVLLVLGVLWLGLGVFWMSRLVRVEV